MADPVTDQELLAKFVRQKSEVAFELLIQRHANLVYSTAFRLLSDPFAAQEITQDVFVALAKKASWLSSEISLGGWLYRTTVFKSKHHWRTSERRKRREEAAGELQAIMKEGDNLLKSLSAVLDEGLMALSERDRKALLLRYFEDQSHREIAHQLGIGEDAARKRVAKGLEQLTSFFRRRGYAVTSTATVAALLEGSIQAAPTAIITGALKTAVAAGGSTSVSGIGLLILNIMGFTKTQTAVISLALVAGPIAWQTSAFLSAKAENRIAAARLNQLRSEIDEYQREQVELDNRLKSSGKSLAYVRSELEHRKARAQAIAAGDDPALYRWSETSAYVRIPKTFFTRIQIYDPALDVAPETQMVRRHSRTLTKQGAISGVLMEAMGLDERAASEVKRAFQDFALRFNQLEQQHTRLTNQLPNGNSTGKYPAVAISVFGKECEPLKNQLLSSLQHVMGPERAQTLWAQCEGEFGNTFHRFGEEAKLWVLNRFKDDSMSIIDEYENGVPSFSRGVSFDELPELFKPIVAQWNDRQAPSNSGGNHE